MIDIENHNFFKLLIEDFKIELPNNLKERKIYKEIEVIQQQPFIEKVDQILALKQDNPEADTTTLEKEIDAMVYALYDLTEEEINIVENS